MMLDASAKNCSRFRQSTRRWSAEAEVRLVNQSGGLEGVFPALPPKLRGGPPAQLLIDQRQQVVLRARVTGRPRQSRSVTTPLGAEEASIRPFPPPLRRRRLGLEPRARDTTEPDFRRNH